VSMLSISSTLVLSFYSRLSLFYFPAAFGCYPLPCPWHIAEAGFAKADRGNNLSLHRDT
jgi:hypothetical protein